MLSKTKGIVLKTIKYGESSIITTIFTSELGKLSFIIQGIRSTKAKNKRSGLFQPGTLLDLVIYNHPNKNLQRINEFHADYFYKSLDENVIKNSICLFTIELLLRLLPEQAPNSLLFEFSKNYLIALDVADSTEIANYPLFYIINISNILGFEMIGTHSDKLSVLGLRPNETKENMPNEISVIYQEDFNALQDLLNKNEIEKISQIKMNSFMRFRLLEWYISFLNEHLQPIGQIKSLPVLKAVLHG